MSAILAPSQVAPKVRFGRLVKAEGRKLFDTRSGTWLFIATVLLTVAGTALGLTVVTTTKALKGTVIHWQEMLGLVGRGTILLLPAIAILHVTSEWSQRTALTTFLVEPRRIRVIVAKALVVAGVTAVVWLLMLGFSALATLAAGKIYHRDLDWTINVGRLLGGLALYEIQVFVGFALAAALLNSPAALVTYYVAPVLVAGFAIIPSAKDTIAWVDLSGAMDQLWETGMTGAYAFQLVTVCVVWLVLPLVIGIRRQVTTEPR